MQKYYLVSSRKVAVVVALFVILPGIVLAQREGPRLAYNTTVVKPLEPLDAHKGTSLTIVDQLRHNHYVKRTIDDRTSSQIFERYLELLDGGRSYFLASDTQKFERYRYTLDDALKKGNLDPAFEIFNVYRTRLADRLQFLITRMEAGVEDMDFTKDEDLELDRELAPWPATMAEMDAYWQLRLKATVLSMKLNGKSLEEIGEVLAKRYRNRLHRTTQTNSEDAFQIYVNAFASTYDPHTQYFSPRTSENFNITMSLSLEGIGAVLSNQDEYTTVMRLVPAGPADKSGLIQPEDRIIAVAQGSKGKMVDVVGWRLDDVVELIRGPAGSRVQLEIIPNGQEDSRVIQITRNTVTLEEQSAQKRLLTYERDGRTRKIGVIDVPTFYVDFKAQQRGDANYKSTTRDVHRLIEELTQEGMDGLIVDLRNNGGGSLAEANSLTGLFIKLGPTVQVKSANNRVNPYYDNDNKVAWAGPLVVLVNRLSASASEIFAGAMQDYQRGLIVGAQTFGKGTVQTLIPLNHGQLKLTQAKFYRISGQSTQHQGVIPDIAYPDIYDAESIGESALDGALPWDVIAPARYRRTDQPIRALVDTLKAQHQTRAGEDPEFAYLRAITEHSRELRDDTLISLNEEKRRKEKMQEDDWRLALENDLRRANGLPQLENLEDLEENSSALARATGGPPPLASVGGETQATAEQDVDALLREGGNILLDFISLTTQVAAQTSLPTEEAVQ